MCVCLMVARVWGISEKCAGGVSLRCACASTRVRCVSLPCLLLLPGNISGVCSHKSPVALGHGVLCSLIGRFLGVGPRPLAALWSSERE